MLATAIIVFRETLEAALVIGIVMAACRDVPNRGMWAGAGLAAGLAGSIVVAVFAGVITAAAEGMGQELLNATILLAAAATLAWHAIWMSSHGSELARHVGDVGRSVAAGERSLAAIAVVIGAAVLREGSETVLFLLGILRGSETSVPAIAAGGLLGAAAGAAAGATLYLGLVRIPLRHFFTATNVLILLVMGGMSAQGVGFLVQAGIVAPLVDPVWDTGWLLNEGSLAGKVMHALVGYESRPTGVQVLAYVGAIATVLLATRLVTRGFERRFVMRVAGGLVLAAAATASLLIAVRPAHAEFKMRYPNIDYREVEIENNVSLSFDKRAEKNHNLSFPTEVGLGVLPFWFVEVEFEASKEPGERTSLDAVTFENYFMLTEQGKYWLDAAIFAEYARSRKSDAADTVELGLLLQKENGKFLHTANLYWEHEVGSLASSADTFKYQWQSRYLLDPLFQPGIEVYGKIEDVNRPGRFNEQQFRLGPMFAGRYSLGEIGGRGTIKYEAGYLFGATTATEQGTLRTRLEYEIGF